MIRPVSKRFAHAAFALLLVSGGAHATPTVRDVVAAIDAGNIHSADVMLQDVLAAHPNNARAHFMDAQVLGMEGRAADGLEQLQTAERLDPTLAFASAERVARAESKLKAELAQTQVPRPVAQADEPRPDIVAHELQPANIPAAPSDEGGHAGTVILFAVAVVVLLAIFAVVMIRHRRRVREADEERRDLMRRMTTLLGLVRELILDSRLSEGGTASALAAEAEGLRGAVSEGLTMLTDSRPFPVSAVDSLEWRAADLRSRLEGRGPLPAPGSNYVAAGAAPQTGPGSADWRGPGYGSPTVYAPQTVFVDTSPDLITAAILADAMRPPPLVIERDVYVTPPSYIPAASRDGYAAERVQPEPASTRSDDDWLRGGARDFDAGNGGGSWSDDSGGGGGIDTGSDSSSGDWS